MRALGSRLCLALACLLGSTGLVRAAEARTPASAPASTPGAAPASAPATGKPDHSGDAFANCADCHVPEDWHKMRSGGVEGFAHDPTGFPLRGRHAGAGCTDCHQGRSLRGARCTTCHTDVHQARNGDRCDTCHTTRDWRLPDALAMHGRTRFPLQGAHLTAECRECHRFAAQNIWKGADTRCASCHADEAKGVHPAHTQPPFTTTCEACHTPYSFERAEIDHGRWWPLTGVHAAQDCSSCHAGSKFAGTPRDCVQCHRDDFRRAHEATESTACAACHTTTAWNQVGNFDHSRFFPLPHRGVKDCEACHPQGTQSLSCMTCHTHSRSRMNSEHDDVRGYAFEAQACYRCHPRGRD
jgi:hypothetical protein